jgi:hypothetical protein
VTLGYSWGRILPQKIRMSKQTYTSDLDGQQVSRSTFYRQKEKNDVQQKRKKRKIQDLLLEKIINVEDEGMIDL